MTKFHRITPVNNTFMNPYTCRSVQVGQTCVLPASQAEYLENSNLLKIVERDVPFYTVKPKPEPRPFDAGSDPSAPIARKERVVEAEEIVSSKPVVKVTTSPASKVSMSS